MAEAQVTEPRMIVGGERAGAASGATCDDLNPATGEPLARVPRAGDEDVDRAVRAAREAREAQDRGPWRKLDGVERGRLLWALGDLVREIADEYTEVKSVWVALS